MRRLQIVDFGTEAQGIQLHGDPVRRPEPTHVRIAFPGGDVDVVRTTEGDYWIHARVNGPDDVQGQDEKVEGQLVDGRLDIRDRHTADVDQGEIEHPDLYHLAIRVARRRSA